MTYLPVDKVAEFFASRGTAPAGVKSRECYCPLAEYLNAVSPRANPMQRWGVSPTAVILRTLNIDPDDMLSDDIAGADTPFDGEYTSDYSDTDFETLDDWAICFIDAVDNVTRDATGNRVPSLTAAEGVIAGNRAAAILAACVADKS